MAFVYRDSVLPSRYKWNGMSSIYQRFKNVWGVSGDTYDEKLIFYQGDSFQESKQLKRFLKGLGVGWQTFIDQDIEDEIEQVWFYIDPIYSWDGSFAGDTRVGSTGDTTQLVAPTAEEITELFNDTFTDGMEIEVTVKYGGPLKRYVSSHELEWSIKLDGTIETESLDKTTIRNTLNSNPWYYFANTRIDRPILDNPQFQKYDGALIDTPNGPNLPSNRLIGVTQVSTTFDGHKKPVGGADEPMYELGIFALMNGSPFEKVGEIYDEQTGTDSTERYDGEALSYQYTQKYIYRGATSDMQTVTDMIKYYSNKKVFTLNRRPVYLPVGSFREDLTYNTKDTIYKRTLDKMNRYQDPNSPDTFRNPTNSLFKNGRLRVYESSMMRRSDFSTMIATCMETDYEVEEASFWEKLAAVVIVILAVVAFIFSLGGTGVITAMVLAQALGAAALTLSIGAFLLSTFGGLSTGDLVQMIGKFAQIVGYAAMIAGVYAAIQEAGKIAAKAALEEAGKEATADAIKNEMLTRSLMDNAGALLEQSIEAAFKPLTEFTTMGLDELASTVGDGIKFITEGLSTYQDNEMEELQAEYDEANEEQRKVETELLNKHLKSPAEVWLMSEDRITSFDALSELNRKMEALIGKDVSFTLMQTNVNSV